MALLQGVAHGEGFVRGYGVDRAPVVAELVRNPLKIGAEPERARLERGDVFLVGKEEVFGAEIVTERRGAGEAQGSEVEAVGHRAVFTEPRRGRVDLRSLEENVDLTDSELGGVLFAPRRRGRGG